MLLCPRLFILLPLIRCLRMPDSLHYEIVVDHTEKSKQCTILPLRDRADFKITRFRATNPPRKLSADILLHPDGISLAELRSDSITKIAALDCIWRRLNTILNNTLEPLPKLVSIPPGFLTAYPRKDKHGDDPSAGFATIEALFITAAFLGKWDLTLLEKYYFGDKFLEINAEAFSKYRLRHNLEFTGIN